MPETNDQPETDADHVAGLLDAAEGLARVAASLGGFRANLIEQGFAPAAADDIVVTWWATLQGQALATAQAKAAQAAQTNPLAQALAQSIERKHR